MTSENEALKVERLSIFTSIIIGIFEFILGLFANSIALLSDGVGSLADSSVSAMVWLGLKMSRKGRDDKFHFGYYRIETFASLTSSIVMGLVGFLILYESYISLIERSVTKATQLAACVALAAAVPSFYLGYRKRLIAKKERWASVSLDSYNSFLGGMGSVVAFIGISLSGIGFYWGDAVAGMIIACLIFVTAYSAFREGSLALVDACNCPDVLETVHEVVRVVPGVEAIHDVRLRRIGPYITGEVHVEVDGELTVSEGHEIGATVEAHLKKMLEEIHTITVKVEPRANHYDSSSSV